ncbi:MAG TPA: histidinol-phosphate transaminase, partial [Methanomicrobiales archaeon]|nr:histidinol-phosphate transaminase [Methanomicrobiales archaeon]
LCNPNNPTGELVRRADALTLLHDISSKGGMLFLDEAFIDLSNPDESLGDVVEPALFVARSLTKSFAIPGLRFGYGFGDEDLVERMETLRLPWTVNAVAEAYALQAFKVYGELARSRRLIAEEREYLTRGLSEMALRCSPSEANYLLVNLPVRASMLQERLLAKGILVRDCTSFGLPDAIRVAVRTHEENSRLLEAIRECLS